MDDGFTPEELEAEASEALPERALMSTVSLAADPTADAVDAVTESAVTTATAAAGDPSVSQPAETTAVPEATAPVDTPGTVDQVGGTVGETLPEVGGTVDQVGGTVGETVPEVGGVVDEVGGTVGETLPDAGEIVDEVDPGGLVDQLGSGGPLLDLDVDLNAALDASAPIDAAVAANANVAAPINAAVSANVLSPGSTSIASADQAALIQQTLIGDANATADQLSTIGQGEGAAGQIEGVTPDATAAPAEATADAGATAPEATTPATTDSGTATPAPTTGEPADAQGLLDLNVDADLDLDVAAPINAAVAANANVAAPINASVSANVGSPDAVSAGIAEQDALVSQTLIGEADAVADQQSAIMQGEEGDEPESDTA